MAGGFVSLVGVEPSDPELLTLRALRVIREAEVVVYDRLVSPEVMALVTVEKVDAGKAPGAHTLKRSACRCSPACRLPDSACDFSYSDAPRHHSPTPTARPQPIVFTKFRYLDSQGIHRDKREKSARILPETG